MIGENTKVILNLKDTLSYEEYCSHINNPDIRGIFFQTAGLALAAKRLNPENPEMAYEEIIKEMNEAFTNKSMDRTPEQVTPVIPGKTGCGTCGGGKVR